MEERFLVVRILLRSPVEIVLEKESVRVQNGIVSIYLLK